MEAVIAGVDEAGPRFGQSRPARRLSNQKAASFKPVLIVDERLGVAAAARRNRAPPSRRAKDGSVGVKRAL